MKKKSELQLPIDLPSDLGRRTLQQKWRRLQNKSGKEGIHGEEEARAEREEEEQTKGEIDAETSPDKEPARVSSAVKG